MHITHSAFLFMTEQYLFQDGFY